MTPADTVWGHVEPGAYIRYGDRTARVDHVRHAPLEAATEAGYKIAFGVMYRDGSTEWLVGHYSDPVTLMIPTGAEAIDAVLRVLGGEVIVREVEHLPTQNTERNRQKMRDHLQHLHGVWPGTKGETPNISDLLEAHAVAHSQWRAGEGIPHTHTNL